MLHWVVVFTLCNSSFASVLVEGVAATGCAEGKLRAQRSAQTKLAMHSENFNLLLSPLA